MKQARANAAGAFRPRPLSSDRFLRRLAGAMAIGLALLAAHGPAAARAPAIDSPGLVRAAELPAEARQTLALIKRGGPFPDARDGAVFANREGRLPAAARGTYREYTVRTPGRRDRGARRIIAEGTRAFWYSADHYRSFRRIIE